MPRVNRDLQRRLAARRERERRRPSTERRYQFASADDAAPAVDDEQAIADGADETLQTAEPPRSAVETPRSARTAAAARSAIEARAARTSARPPARTFAEYAPEYRYVLSDLRRVALVVGSLLVILIVLAFVLPR